MNKNRLEAFSDGVLAMIITIMVLEIKVPHGREWADIKPLLPVFVSYLLSFIYVGIYWGNHHHLLHSVKKISSGIIWANFNQLFWLSLIPFSTGWVVESDFASSAVSLYGIVFVLSGISYTILQKAVEKHAHDLDELKKAFRNLKKKGIASTVLYLSAIPLAYVSPIISVVLYFVVAAIWLIPDKSLERALTQEN